MFLCTYFHVFIVPMYSKTAKSKAGWRNRAKSTSALKSAGSFWPNAFYTITSSRRYNFSATNKILPISKVLISF